MLFLAANLTKIGHGAWLPLLIGLVAFTVMTTWQKGRAIVAQRREHEEGSLRTFIDELHTRELPVERVPGPRCSSTARRSRRRWRCARSSSTCTR